jgi:hypothetical protein
VSRSSRRGFWVVDAWSWVMVISLVVFAARHADVTRSGASHTNGAAGGLTRAPGASRLAIRK